MPVSVAKFTQPGCGIQMVRKAVSAPAIGAQIFCGSSADYLIPCLITVNICGTHPAAEIKRRWLSRSQPKKGVMMKTSKASFCGAKTNEVSFAKTSKASCCGAKRKLLSSLILAVLAVPGMALAEEDEFTSHKEWKHVIPASEHTFTANVGLTTDYVFNGISQNFRSPAVQGGFDYAHSSGGYLGTWASNISGNQYTNASMEWDVYGGYNGKITDDLGYNVGLMAVFYPGGKTNPAGPTRKWDTNELLVGGTWKGLNIKYTYTLTDWYGISSANGGGFEPVMIVNNAATATCVSDNNCAGNLSSRGSGYIEGNYTYEFADSWTITGHVGHQKIRNFSRLNYTDYKLALNRIHAGFNFGLAYTNTNATDNSLYHVIANGDNKKLSGSILALSVSRSF